VVAACWRAAGPGAGNGCLSGLPKKGKLPRSESLKSRLEIASILREGNRLPGNYFTLVWRPAQRFGYAVLLSRRHGLAVRRNRIKRLYREAIRLCRSRLPQAGSVIILPDVSNRMPAFQQILSDVCRVFEKLEA
jgi:ribonuclease P protein component